MNSYVIVIAFVMLVGFLGIYSDFYEKVGEALVPVGKFFQQAQSQLTRGEGTYCCSYQWVQNSEAVSKEEIMEGKYKILDSLCRDKLSEGESEFNERTEKFYKLLEGEC